MKDKTAYLILGAMMLILLATQLILPPATLVWDEAAFLGNARDLIGDSQYTEWFRNPLPSVIFASTWLVTGESVTAARLTSTAFGMLALLLAYLIAKKHTTTTWSLVIAASLLANEQFLFWSGFAYGEIIALTFILLGIYALEKENKYWYGVAGLAFGLSFLARFANALTIALAGIYILTKIPWKKIKKIQDLRPAISYGIGVLIAVLPWLIKNLVRYGQAFWDVLEQGRIIAAYTIKEPILPFVITLISFSSIYLIIIATGAFTTKKQRPAIVWLWWANLLIYLGLHLFIIRLKLPRYGLALLPFLLVLAAHELKHINPKKTMAACIISLLAITMLLQGAAYAERKDALLRCDELIPLMNEAFTPEQNSTLGSNIWMYYGYLKNMRARALFTNNWTEYEEKVHPDYIMYATDMGHAYDENIILTLENEGVLAKETSVTMDCGRITLWKVLQQ